MDRGRCIANAADRVRLILRRSLIKQRVDTRDDPLRKLVPIQPKN